MNKAWFAYSERKKCNRYEINLDTYCWDWKQSIGSSGYGRVFWDGKFYYAHRVSYELFIGPIPEGLQIDHIVCDNKACVNPFHMKPATNKDNSLRSDSPPSRNARKTHCPQGHEYDYVKSNGDRGCKICRRKNDLASYYRNKTNAAG